VKLFKNVIIELIIISEVQWTSIFLARIKAAAFNRIVDYDRSWKDDYQDLWLRSRFYVQQHIDILTCTFIAFSICCNLYAIFAMQHSRFCKPYLSCRMC